MAHVACMHAIHFTAILNGRKSESIKIRDLVMSPCLSDYDLMARMQGSVVGIVSERDIRPGDLKGTCSPSERARVEDGRNRDS